ncbi:hypothetical protein ACNQ2I_02670 [Mycoplasma sp. Z355B]|uniref:hypothetical protein n=1 Tax=Mycoplasma sp. Z355B TaxID=3401689 RepID=UPI003AAC8364
MEEIQNQDTSFKAKTLLDKALSKYWNIIMIRALLAFTVLLAVFAIISLVKWSTVAGWILLALCLISLVCYWIYLTFRINPAIESMQKQLDTYKPYFKEYYLKLSKLNKFIFKYFFVVELYDQEQVNQLLNDSVNKQENNNDQANKE